jgi:putative transposase
MPRRTPHNTGGLVFHVLNRGVRRMQLFDRPGDYRLFLDLFRETQRRVPIRCLAYCLMPNHFHVVLWPREDGEMSQFMFRFTTTHSKRWHLAHGSNGTGAVYQGRFKSIPVCTDGYFLRLCRYVERNPVRAGLTSKCEQWPWSSAGQAAGLGGRVLLSAWPVDRPQDWSGILNDIERPAETEDVRAAVRRNAPFGPAAWQMRLASRLEISRSLSAIGRPRKPTPGVLFPVEK